MTETGLDPAGMKLAEIHRQPAHLVRRAHQIAVSFFLEECRDWGLTSIQYGILCVVDEAGALEQHVLADMLALDRSNISEVVTRLEQRGLLERRAGVADRRTKCLYITDAGKALLAEMTASVQAHSAAHWDSSNASAPPRGSPIREKVTTVGTSTVIPWIASLPGRDTPQVV